jgi:hypothetical protein
MGANGPPFFGGIIILHFCEFIIHRELKKNKSVENYCKEDFFRLKYSMKKKKAPEVDTGGQNR